MATANDIYKADLAEFSHSIYETFLHKVFRDIKHNIPRRHVSLLYCYFNRCISTSQLSILFGGTRLKVKSNYMMMKRLIDNGYINRYIGKANSRSKSSETVYVITTKGIKYCNEIITSLFPELLPDVSFNYSGHQFSLEEVLDYLSMRSQFDLPAYIDHYLGARDINAYLLSHPLSNGKYTYETEVGISESGIPVSLYTRSLLGFKMYSHPIRSDAVLTYPLSKGNDILCFFIELDTGTQRAAILTDKIQNYLDNYLKSNSFSPMSSLLFSLQTNVDESRKELRNLKSGYGSRDYYYLVMLEFGFSMMSSVLPDGTRVKTVGEAIKYLERLNNLGKLNDADKMVYKYFVETTAIDRTIPLDGLKNNYHVSRDVLAMKKAKVLSSLHEKTYYDRRAILHKSASSLKGLKEFFLKGFSLYSIHNFNIGSTFPYLLPEMFGARERLYKIFSSFGYVKRNTWPKYRLFYKVDNNGFFLKNSYLFNQERLHVIIENVSDDLGGLCRIQHLLDHSSIPSSLMSSKIICLYDDNSYEMIKDIFISSSMGKELMSKNGSRGIDNDFEVMFISYKAFEECNFPFVFNKKGDAIYKHD